MIVVEVLRYFIERTPHHTDWHMLYTLNAQIEVDSMVCGKETHIRNHSPHNNEQMREYYNIFKLSETHTHTQQKNKIINWPKQLLCVCGYCFFVLSRRFVLFFSLCLYSYSFAAHSAIHLSNSNSISSIYAISCSEQIKIH